jgi:putative transposase
VNARALAETVGVVSACAALEIPRAAYYRARTSSRESAQSSSVPVESSSQRRSPRALSEDERQQVISLLDSERFVDKAPPTIFAELLDEDRYVCSVRTMYRLLAARGEVRERRNQRRHPEYAKPELLATGPNQVWSWDITKLLGPRKWTYYYLYVILDIFSRYTVGWLLAERESAELAKRLIRETVAKQEVDPQQLTIHSDRGTSMGSKLVAQLLADLGVTKSHSRPQVSDDNPYSEAQFKTLKYRPEFPGRFGSLEDGLSFCRSFFAWYNDEHRHSGVAYMTPRAMHYGESSTIHAARSAALAKAYAEHPERFVRGRPQAPALPEAAWINAPKEEAVVGSARKGEEREALPGGTCAGGAGAGSPPQEGAGSRSEHHFSSMPSETGATDDEPPKGPRRDFAPQSDLRGSSESDDLDATRPVGPLDMQLAEAGLVTSTHPTRRLCSLNS